MSPPHAPPAATSHPTLSSVDRAELEKVKVDSNAIRLSDAVLAEGVQRAEAEAFLRGALKSDVRDWITLPSDGLEPFVSGIFAKLLRSDASAWAQCIVVEVQDGFGAGTPVAVQFAVRRPRRTLQEVEQNVEKRRSTSVVYPEAAKGIPGLELPAELRLDIDARRNRIYSGRIFLQKPPHWRAMFSHLFELACVDPLHTNTLQFNTLQFNKLQFSALRPMSSSKLNCNRYRFVTFTRRIS
jgi:hypothetical protein